MKKTRKITALLLTVLLICSLFSVNVTATDKLNYVVLGDSIAYGSGLINPVEACYGKIIADTCDFDYANYSVPGANTNALINRLSDKTVIEAVKEADIISISIGGNDFLMDDIMGLMFDAIVKKDYSAFDKIADVNYTNLCKIMSIIKAANPDALILMQTLYNPQQGHIREPYQQGADRINAGILRYAEENPGSITIVDVASTLNDDMGNFATDDIHPSAKGNERIAKAVLSTLNSLGVTDKTDLVIETKGVDFTLSATYSWAFRFYGTFLYVLSVILNPVLNAFG